MNKKQSTIFICLMCIISLGFILPHVTFAEANNVEQTLSKKPMTEDELQKLLQKPQPRINIPGLNFSDIDIEGLTETDSEGDVYLYIPFVGEYLSAIYRYGIIIIGIVAVIIIIIGGLQWTMSGGSPDAIGSAKKRITGALIGLLLAVGSYTILHTVNPNLVNFKNLKILYIAGESFPDLIELWDFDTSKIEYQIITDPNFHHSTVPSTYTLDDNMIKEIALKNNIDPCVAWTIIKKESGGKGLAIGYDENYPHNKRGDKCPYVGARAQFLISGVKNSGEEFTPVAGCMWGTKKNPVTCTNPYDPCTMNNTPIKNDGKFDSSKPPDYNLDWRFSKGIGIGQMTIVPGKSYCAKIDGPNGLEWARKVGNNWYTVTDLLNPDKSIEATMVLIKTLWEKSKGDLDTFFKLYAGGAGGVARAKKHYAGCPLK